MLGEASRGNHRVRVKICGITTLADALAAIEYGADALGFNFFPGSKRCLNVQAASDWLVTLPSSIAKIGVLVNPKLEEAITLAKFPFIDALQLHGAESPGFCRRLAEHGIRFVKAIPVSETQVDVVAPDFFTDIVLLDSSSARGFGGTGTTFSWPLAYRFVEAHSELKVILAGGLTPENVGEAVAQVGPFGVDVTTGVEASSGRKDLARLRAFFKALHR